jgi:hypothetical protein
MKILYILVFPFILFSCGGASINLEEQESNEVDYKPYLEENRTDLEKWISDIQAVQDAEATEELVFKEKENIEFDFTEVKGTHTGNAYVNETFNSVLVSPFSFGEDLMEGMNRDFFECDLYDVVFDLVNDSYDFNGSLPSKNDERFGSAALAFLKSIEKVKYVFYVTVSKFEAGNVFSSTGSLFESSMSGKVITYDFEKKEVIESTNFDIPGFEEFFWQEYETDSPEKKQERADEALAKKNQEYFPKEILKLCAPNNNWN